MPELGSLWYSLSLKDLTDADIKKINDKLKNLGSDLLINPKLAKAVTEILPKGIKLELDPQLKAVSNEALAKAVEGKVMKVEIAPLLTNLRKALKDGTKDNPPEVEVGVQAAKLRTLIQDVLNKHGFLINVTTLNDNYTKVVQQKLNGTRYKVKIHADAKEITQSVQASLMQVQSRTFGLQVTKDVLRRSIDEALMGKPFPIQIAVQHDQARKAVQDALLSAQVIGKDQALAYQRLQTGELKAAQAELARLKAAHMGAADAAKAHATASINLGGALGRNITIAGELSSAMASLYSVHAAKEFLSQVIEIGGELEHQKIAMDTIFGDKGKTSELFGQIKSLARQSPFGVMELTKSVKALSAYGVQYNEIYDTAKRLADISAATSVDINRLILAFGKTKSRTFLDGLEAKQFAYANIPIYDLLSKKLTELEGHYVSIGEVMERQKKRQIGFDLVKDVLWEITDPGGKFYNMQEALAGSVKTLWKLVRDNIELMFGEIAESKVGDALKSVAQVLQSLTREWRSVGAVVSSAALAFGLYKAAVLATNIVIGQNYVASIKTIQTENAKAASLARTASFYRQLTAAEADALALESGLNNARKMSLLTRRQLTVADIEALYASKALTKDSLMRLAATGRLSKGCLTLMRQTELLTYADMRYLAKLRMTTTFMGIQGKAASALAMRFKILSASVGATVKSLASMVLNPITAAMAAVGVAVHTIQKNSQENDTAESFGKNFQTKGEEAAKNIGKSLKKNINVSGHEAEQLLEEYRNLIKDYSSTPDSIITDALFDDNGKIRDTAEQIAYLRSQLEQLRATAEDMADSNVENVIKSTNSGSGLFDDDIITDIKDWDSATKDAQAAYLKFVTQNKEVAEQMVKAAVNVDSQYSASIANMETLYEKFSELMNNRQKYSAGYKAAEEVSGGKLDEYTGKWILNLALNTNLATKALEEFTGVYAKLRNLIGIRSTAESAGNSEESLEEMRKEIEQGADAFKTLTEDWDYNNLKPAQVEFARKFWNGIIEQAGIAAPGAREEIQKIISDTLGIDIKGIEGQSLILQELQSGGDRYLSEELARKVSNGLEVTPEEQRQVDAAIREAYLKLFNNARKNQDKWMMEALNSAVAEDGHFSKNKIFRIQAQLDLTADWDEWKRDINQKLNGDNEARLWISGSSDVLSFVKAAQEGYAAAKTAIDGLKPLMLKAGIGFEAGERIPVITQDYKNLSPAAKQLVDDYNRAIDEIEAAINSGKELGFDPAALYNKKNKNQRTPKDKFAESLKQRFKDIKDAWSEFQKWSKTEGREAAATRIGESGLFSTLSADKIPQTVEQYRALVVELENELRQAGVKGTARESLLNDLLKQLLDIDKTVVDEQIKLALDKVSKEAERQLADWNLFDKIRKATGNQDLAMSIAFGMNATAETDYPAMIKQQFNDFAKAAKSALTFDTATPELLANAPDEVKKAWEDATKKLQQYAREQKDAIADILNEYQSLQDKLTKIDADRDRKIKTVNESDMSAPDKAKYIQRINVEADYQKFTQSADYLKFFSGIYSLTMEKAQEIGDKIRLHLDQRLQAGKISAEDYYKEIERINQQLSKLRNVKSDALTFLTGGVKGVQQKKLDVADSKVLDQMTKVQEAQEALEKAKASGDIKQIAAAELTLKLAETELETRLKIRDAIVKDMEGWQKVLDVVGVVNNIAGGMSDAFNTLRDMADSFGFDTESNAWETAAAVMDTLTTVTGGVQKVIQSAMSGDIGGIISGAFDTLLTPFTIWNKLHDKKLDKMIERSKEAAQIMQNQYDILEKRMANFLGNAANMKVEGYSGEGGAYGKQRELMQGQLAELEKQRQAELDKKKTDDSVVADYDKQIEEMKIAIQDFALEAANALYGIDLNGWAEQLGDALVDAFAAGEDAAKAFDNTVGDIMRDVTSKMISQDILAPMFGDLRDYLFGKNGKGGAFGADFKLDASEMASMKTYLDKIKNEGIPAAEELFDAIDEATGGLISASNDASSSIRAGIQGIKEDQADLLASYLNAIRADVAMQTGSYWTRLLDDALPQMNVIAQSQLDTQRQIAENTLRNAVAAEAIQESTAKLVEINDQMGRSWRRIAERNWGYS